MWLESMVACMVLVACMVSLNMLNMAEHAICMGRGIFVFYEYIHTSLMDICYNMCYSVLDPIAMEV
jgi:hypothetical protein